jgi:hypothetical protein
MKDSERRVRGIICQSLLLGLALLSCRISLASNCDPFTEVASAYQTHLDDVVRVLDEESAESAATVRKLLRESGWDGRAESLHFDDDGIVQFDVPDDILPLYQKAQIDFRRKNSARMIEVRRLQQLDFINESLVAFEMIADGRYSEIEPFSPRADALEILRQTLERVGVDQLPKSFDSENSTCDLSSAIRIKSMEKREELDADPGFQSRTREVMEFDKTHASDIENDSLSPSLQAKYESLGASIENDLMQMRYVHYMWLLAALNDMSVIIRDSNLIDADRYDGDQNKFGLYLDEQRSQGRISELQWEIGRHWILFNRKYDTNDYHYGEFSGWDNAL